MANSTCVFEILTWKSKPGISDEKMITSVNAMVPDLKNLDGFLNQQLYKNSDGVWVDIYYWKTEKNAQDSNTSMAAKSSFKTLIDLIEPDSITLEIMHTLQSSDELIFKG